MLDAFIEVAYKHETEKVANRKLVDDLKSLPLEELIGLVNGEPSEAMKLAFATCAPMGEGGDCWLDKFKSSPLFERACQLEQQLLEIETKEIEARMQQPAMDQFWRARDQICLQKRLLDLELAKSQAAGPQGAAGEPQALEAMEGAGLDMAQQAHKTEQAQQGKVAKVLTENAREHIAPKNFAVSAKQSDTGKPAYPIEDKAHARAALGLVGMHGSPAEKAEVRKDVARKYPGMEEKKEAGTDNPQGAGAPGSYEADPKDTVTSSAKQAADEDPKGHHLRRALLGTGPSAAMEAQPGSKMKALGEGFVHDLKGTAKGLAIGGLGGAGAGALGGALTGKDIKGLALLGGLLGGEFGAAAGGMHARHNAEGSEIHGKYAAEEVAVKIAFADEMGRRLAQSEKKKEALDVSGVLGAGKALLGKGVQLAAQHPKAVLPALGAAGGAALGAATAQPGHRMGGALGGAAAGGLAGSVGNQWAPAMAQGAQKMVAGLAR